MQRFGFVDDVVWVQISGAGIEKVVGIVYGTLRIRMIANSTCKFAFVFSVEKNSCLS